MVCRWSVVLRTKGPAEPYKHSLGTDGGRGREESVVPDAVGKPGGEDALREMTPEEIRDAFRRYDLIIGLFTLLMAFFAASFLASSPDLWRRAHHGNQLLESFPSFPTVSHFSYTGSSATGVDPAWLYNILSAGLLRLGDVAFVAAKVAAVVASVFLLLTIRCRPAPFSWPVWSVGLAIVAMSGHLDVGPTIASYLLLSAVLWLGHQAAVTGRPVFYLVAGIILLLWANVDIAYPIGGGVLLAFLLGDGLFGSTLAPETIGQTNRSRPIMIAIAALFAVGAGLVSPFGLANWLFPWQMIPVYQSLPSLDYGWEGWASPLEAMKRGDWTPDLVAWVVLLLTAGGVVLAGFQRISATRVMLLLVALVSAYCHRWIGLSGIILAFVASQGGQEFAARNLRAGVQTTGWGLIRAQLVVVLLLIALFGGMLSALTGRMQGRLAQFGFGIDRNQFAQETADWLKGSGLAGKTFHISPGNSIDSFLSYTLPSHRSFLDPRWPLDEKGFSVYERLRISLTGLSPEKANDWKETFKKLGITHVVVDAREETEVMRAIRQGLARRSDLAPIAVDDQAIVYGWLSDEHADYAVVKEKRIQANTLAFRTKREPPPPTDRAVTAPSLIDKVWPLRMVARPPGLIRGTFFSTGGRWLSQPGAGVIAASYLRSAVSANPDNPDAHLRLGLAYLNLSLNELAQLPPDFESIGPSPSLPSKDAASKEAGANENPPKAMKQMIPSDIVLTRHHQTMAALQSALLAGADQWKPETALGIHTSMALACERNRFMDLWLKHLREQRRASRSPEQLALIDRQMQLVKNDVDQRLQLFEQQIKQLSDERRAEATRIEGEAAKLSETLKNASDADRRRLEMELEMGRRQVALLRADAERDRPMENAQVAFALDLPGRALEEIEKVPATSPEADANADFIVRVLLRLGFPDKAGERLRLMRGASRLGPGVYFWLLAQTQLTSGQFEPARLSMEQAIAEVKAARLRESLESGFATVLQGRMITRDGAIPFTEALRTVSAAGLEASFCYDLAIIHLELAQPERAREDFLRVLELAPGFKLIPIIDFYAKEISDKPLPRSASPSPDDDIVVRFPEPPAAPPEANPSAPTPTPAPESPAPTPGEKNS
jgi:tetratricopeptide (TPR) repeat protein